MNKSEQVNELFEALAKAQAVMPKAALDSVNPHFKSKYASAESIQNAYRKPLGDNGLSVMQLVRSDDTGTYIDTTLGHKSGQFISSTMKLIIDKQNMQGLGSAITYGRRYAVSAMLGIVDTEDDDGNQASGPPQRAPVKNFAPRPQPEIDPLDLALRGNPGEYVVVIPTSKNKGKMIKDIPRSELSNFVSWYDNEGNKLRSSVGVQEFYDNVMAYISEGHG